VKAHNPSQEPIFAVPPNSVYVWRGYKASKVTLDQFAGILGSVFVPACALLQPPVGLTAYLPSILLDDEKPSNVPDQTALMFWATPQSHDLAKKAIAVRIYQSLHGDLYDMEKSHTPEVPISIHQQTGTLVAEQPYYLLDQNADWMLGSTYHFVGTRKPEVASSVFLKEVYDWSLKFANSSPSTIDGALVCCGLNYVAAWVHSPQPQQDLAPTVSDLNAFAFVVLKTSPQPLSLEAGLWSDWPGLDLTKNPSISLQFSRTLNHESHYPL
jgi:hypothetical protein